MSAELATEWIEAQALGTEGGWRWQRTWSGMYALIIAEQLVDEPPLVDDAR